MRTFSSYGPVDKDLHFYVPRTERVEAACRRLRGEGPEKGGHFITVWAPRQCGKTWIMREVLEKIREEGRFEVAMISMQSAKTVADDGEMLDWFVRKLADWFGRPFPGISAWKELHRLFAPPHFEAPLVLILDEFDALDEDFINKFANEFRDIYISRQIEGPSGESVRKCRLHGLALIGVRSVLGIENVTGSPFNVQRSMRIPNLRPDEVRSMFHWYETESGQAVDPEVAGRVYDETRGQPGLVSWFGELLTETFNRDPNRPISSEDFERAYAQAVQTLPNNHVPNIIGKARQEPYRDTVLQMFRTDRKIEFAFDDPRQNFLYMNGVIDFEAGEPGIFVRFSSPFVQKRLFAYFSREIFRAVDHLYDPMTDIEAVANETGIDIPALMRLYQVYLDRNRDWLLRDAPRRKTDLRIFEAVFHFNLYMYLKAFFQDKGGAVFPEFPAGNGAVDILVRRNERLYALELKSFKDRYAHRRALAQAATYAVRLGIDEIFLILFIESIDEENRRILETPHRDEETGATVVPIFIQTGNASGGWTNG